MNDENVQREKPTPPPLRELRDGAIPKRRWRPPKARLPEGVVRAEDAKPLTYENLEEAISEMDKQAADPSSGVGSITVPLEVSEDLQRMLAHPLLTLHLRRAKNEITDATGQVHIPASGAIPDGTKLVAHFYRDE